MSKLTKVLMLSVALLAMPSVASAKWTRLSTEHFVFLGDASERDIRGIAQRLELFREVLSRLFTGRATSTPVPTVVVVFQNARSFEAFTPKFEGRLVQLAGYFTATEDANYIAVNAEQERLAYGVIFHEYAHFLVRNAIGNVPLWANEGLAGFYQTFEPRDGGKGAMLGLADGDNVALLQNTPSWLSLAELLAVDHASPLYNEGNRRGVFYAQSWALVHYLTLGSPAREGQLQKYLTAVRQGLAPAEAFTQAFGSDAAALERELRLYVRRLTLNALRLTFNNRIETTEAARGEVITDTDGAGYLGELMASAGRIEEARLYLKKAIDADGSAARAMAALGLLELREAHEDVAFPLIERAAGIAPQLASAQRTHGQLLLRRAMRGGTDEDESFVRAVAALTRAFELEPHNTATAVALARAEMGTDAGAARAVALLRDVVAMVPGREDYRLLLADALIRRRDYTGALNYLGPLIARPGQPETAIAARRMMAYIADVRNRDMRLAQAEAADAADAAAAPPALPTVPAVTPSEPRRQTAAQGVFVPALRPVRPGETRVLGVFSAVDCRPGAIVLMVETASGPARLAVPSFDDVEFLSYRPDAPAGIPCGPQRPSYRVLATFRTDAPPLPNAGTPNRAVAIELLPDGYTPR